MFSTRYDLFYKPWNFSNLIELNRVMWEVDWNYKQFGSQETVPLHNLNINSNAEHMTYYGI